MIGKIYANWAFAKKFSKIILNSKIKKHFDSVMFYVSIQEFFMYKNTTQKSAENYSLESQLIDSLLYNY